jgi:hypothetical protein
MKLLGLVPEYRWIYRADELAVTVSRLGPVVLGADWWTGFFEPDSDGVLNMTGHVEGGHCVLVNGYNVKRRAFKIHNSWSRDWGLDGEAWLPDEAMVELMRTGAEGCQPVRRSK